MLIHGMCIVRDEVDIIAETLNRAAIWCDYIYVLDNGSTDGTWELLQSLSSEREKIILFKQDDRPFLDSHRREIYLNYRYNSNAGDWWCRLDADEIYIDDPRHFLSEVPKCYQMVWAAMFQYYFTDKDLVRYERESSSYDSDVSVESRNRYYLNQWSEPRFFRDSRGLCWRKGRDWPIVGASYPVRIRLKHFQYRSPQQIQKRIMNRRQCGTRGGVVFLHEILPQWSVFMKNPKALMNDEFLKPAHLDVKNTELSLTGEEWKDRIVKADDLYFDDHSGGYVTREDLMPEIRGTSVIHANIKKIAKKYFIFWR